MGRKAVTEEVYNKLIAAFRDGPGIINRAARLADVDWRTAKKAWETGWPRKNFHPIKKVIAEDRVKARAALEAAQAAKRAMIEKEREEARKQAIEALKQEGQMVGFARAQSLQNLAVAIELGRMVRAMIPSLKEFADVEVQKIQAWTNYEKQLLQGADPALTPVPSMARPSLSLERAVGLAQKVSSIAQEIVATAYQAMQMERLRLGQPTEIMGFAGLGPDESISFEEAEARLAAANQALEQAKKTVHLRLIEGGAGASDVSDSDGAADGAG